MEKEKDKVLNFVLTSIQNSDGEWYAQKVTSPEEEEIDFFVYNWPEDATIDNDLFNGLDYIAAVELGMRLAHKGYNWIVFNAETEIEID